VRNIIVEFSIITFSHPHFSFFFLDSKTFLRTIFSNTLNLRFLSHATDQVLHPYRKTGEIIGLCTATFIPLDKKWEDKRFWKIR
jgi:hypothetical protein